MIDREILGNILYVIIFDIQLLTICLSSGPHYNLIRTLVGMNSQRLGAICPRLHSSLRAERELGGRRVYVSPPQPKPSVSPGKGGTVPWLRRSVPRASKGFPINCHHILILLEMINFHSFLIPP